MRSLLYSSLAISTILVGCQSDGNRCQHQQVVAQVDQPGYAEPNLYNVSEEAGTAYIGGGESKCAVPRKECVSPAPAKACVTPAPKTDGKVNFDQSDVSWSDDDPIYGHAKNYSWLIGNLQKVHVTGKTWKIRYARLDEEDRYGGTAVLTPDTRIDQFQDGDFVYVEGHVLNERSSVYLAGPDYRIRSIRKVTNSDRRKLWTAQKATGKSIR